MMSDRSMSPIKRSSVDRGRSPSTPTHRRKQSFSSRSGSSRSYSRSPSRSGSYSRRHRSRSRSRSPYSYSRSNYRQYYSRSPSRRSPLRGYKSRSPPRRRSAKDCKVYVSNLAFDVTWRHLKDYMRKAGPVAHADIMKTGSGKSKGCGVVEYRYPGDAKRAIHTMNKADFMGRPIFIREDRDYDMPGPMKDPRQAPDECRLSVSNLPYSASWQDMKDLFRKAGRVLHTDINTEPGTRRSKGTGVVIFDDPRDARKAIEILNGYEWQGRILEVKEDSQSDDRQPRSTYSEGSIHHVPSTGVPRNDHKLDTTYTNDVYQSPLPPLSYTAIKGDMVGNYDNMYGYNQDIMPPHQLQQSMSQIPVYSHVSTVGGPAANLPTHGHNQIYVNNLPFSTTWQDLIDLFRHVGPVIRSEILSTNGHPKGAGFVRFEDAVTCDRAIEKFNGYMYGGRILEIRLDKYSTTMS
ncbi:hypothetical protein BDB01DRAFT_769543 [Pilobolus umbonatus]|nr:hypothetical protein BDB01DRAFT_769543 [Pilobolus umbonatus]